MSLLMMCFFNVIVVHHFEYLKKQYKNLLEKQIIKVIFLLLLVVGKTAVTI